jgi:hypothetical protein
MSDDVKPWLVKDFPVSLREKINNAAYEAKTTVPVWLVNYFNTYGIGGEVINVKPTPAKPRGGTGQIDLDRLIAMAALPLPRWLMSRVNRLLGEALGVAPPPPSQKLLERRAEIAKIAAPQAVEPSDINELDTAA